MIYETNLGSGQHIAIAQQGNTTIITLTSAQHGQQQRQQHGHPTGPWTAPPTMFRTPSGVMIRIETAHGQFFFQIHGHQVAMLSTAPSLFDAEVLPMQQQHQASTTTVASSFGPIQPMSPMKPMEPMRPMEPMQPMQPMSSMDPMQMRMGSMQMQMGTPSSPSPSPIMDPSLSPHTLPPTTPTSFTREQIQHALDSLDMRVSMGELSEETYHRLRKKWQDYLDQLDGGPPPR